MRPCIEFQYPEFSGCYALVRQGRVVYVGQSQNVLTRLSDWRNKLRRFKSGLSVEGQNKSRVVIDFERVKVYPCPMAELDALEEELILLYDPALNTRKKPRRHKVDIAVLAARAGLDIEKWRITGSEKYSPPQYKTYRRA